ncbi:MAG: redoxin domain-containing protein [Sulfolobaceae archaeon]|nr:redoxin domain-containing protein [Sulfolobaceae archaeon]
MVEIGERFPSIKLLNQDLKEVQLPEQYAGKPLVIAFFPAAFTSVCTKEMCTFRDSMANFNKLNAIVVGISVDNPFVLKAFKETYKLNFDLLSDYQRILVSKLNIGFELPVLKGYTLAKRSVFVLDKDGKVVYKWVSDDPGVEPNYPEVQKVVSSLS